MERGGFDYVKQVKIRQYESKWMNASYGMTLMKMACNMVESNRRIRQGRIEKSKVTPGKERRGEQKKKIKIEEGERR